MLGVAMTSKVKRWSPLGEGILRRLSLVHRQRRSPSDSTGDPAASRGVATPDGPPSGAGMLREQGGGDAPAVVALVSEIPVVPVSTRASVVDDEAVVGLRWPLAHQVSEVTVTRAEAEDRYGDVFVDTERSMQVFREWLAKTRPAPGPGGLRRPLHFARVVRPTDAAYRLPR